MSNYTISLAFSVESPRPERKGLRRIADYVIIVIKEVERPRPERKGLRLI